MPWPIELGNIKWQFAIGTNDAFLAQVKKFRIYYFEKWKEDQEHPDSDEIEAKIMQEEKVFLAEIVGEEKVDSDISECSVDKI